MTFHLADSALDLEILRTLDETDVRMSGPQISVAIGQQSGGATRVCLRCEELHQRGLIFSVEQRFWKISTSGKLLLKKGEL